jgi:chromosomal replication initiator protein
MKPRPKLDDIVTAAAHVYGVSEDYIKQDTNKRKVTRIRQIVHYLACRLTHLSLMEIGEQVGKRDHATVIHSRRLVGNEYDLYDDTKYLVDRVLRRLTYEGFSIKTNGQLEIEATKKAWERINTEKRGTTSNVT